MDNDQFKPQTARELRLFTQLQECTQLVHLLVQEQYKYRVQLMVLKARLNELGQAPISSTREGEGQDEDEDDDDLSGEEQIETRLK